MYSDGGGEGGGGGKAASSSASSASAINFGSDIINADGSLTPLAGVILGVAALLSFVGVIVLLARSK